MSKSEIKITDYKILKTIALLNQDNFYPLSEGVYKILSGVDDEETKNFKHLQTYSSLTSISSKKLTLKITILFRHNYLEKRYDPKTDQLYLKISNHGLFILQEYEKNHHVKIKQKKRDNAKTIVSL